MYKYTLAFIKKDNKILMLNRNKSPWMGSWNGVGGKLEKNETPLEAIIREVKEETNLVVTESQVLDKGLVTWNEDANIGGLHVFLINIDNNQVVYETPLNTREGILDWKEIDWISDFDNYGVCDNIPYFINDVLFNEIRYNHYCQFEDKILLTVKKTVI